uniref:tRNA (cytosine(34)-C(5))-methyltransferase n=1 Tax=Setaria digitata TaxID=48799 RepID=A0A915PUY4_9BILA
MGKRGIRNRRRNSDVVPKKAGIVKDDEWDAFIATLKDDLPTSFRIQGSTNEAQSLIELMNRRYFEPMKEWEDGDVFIPKPLPWYSYAFQTPVSRAVLRSRPLLKSFHNFLITEAELGNISRQEAVSMIPPLLLDIKPHHKVLDVCAAPGSKTMQIIEMMHRNDKIPEGLILANDVDNSRCYLLVRQVLKRMPTSNCIVINEDAAFLPDLSVNKDSWEPLLFDRVLCDVICSGDGTFRKSPDMWQSWNPVKGLGLHKLQVNIARRAAQLLAINGLMVYSTCSLNPIENEAVIASLLRYSAGALELVDVSQQLPQLRRTSGLSKWRVFDKAMREYHNLEEVVADQKRYFTSSMFPPNSEEIQKFHLDRCCGKIHLLDYGIFPKSCQLLSEYTHALHKTFFFSFRILPHMQNTGGFFVAVLKKLKSLNHSDLAFDIPPVKRRRTFKEDPFVFLEKDDIRWKDIANHYGVSEMFPHENLLGRTTETNKKRTLYFVNSAVKQFLLCNQDKVKVINAGIRMFGRVENKYDLCRFRILQDGIRTILPYLKKRIVEISAEDMRKILKPGNGSENCPRNGLACDEKFRDISSGSVVLVSEFNGLKQIVCVWMGARSLAPYVSKEGRIHALRMLGCDTSDLDGAMWTKRQSKAVHNGKEAEKRKTPKKPGPMEKEGKVLSSDLPEKEKERKDFFVHLQMKRALVTDELFRKLTFGIKKSQLRYKKQETNQNALLMRILPDDYKERYERNEDTNDEASKNLATFGKEPEILGGCESVRRKRKKCRSLTVKREKVAHLRKLNHIFVWGDDIPDPLVHFTEINCFSKELYDNLKEFGIAEPTPIQMQAIPLMMQKRDLLCSAPTGSGKTLAFALPIIVDVMRKNQCTMLNAIVLEPTYELAKQTYIQFLKFSQNLPITYSFLEGDEIPENVNIVISTPNKMVYALEKSKKMLSSDNLNWLIIDESDRLFDTTEGDSSATFSYEVEDWCKRNLYDMAMICVGARNSAVESVRQELIYAGSEHGKIVGLKILFQNSFEPPALVFVQSKLRAKELVSVMESFQPPIPVKMISSEKTETERESAIAEFRSGQVWVLVCTDLMGRGLDLSGVNLVINFDLPTSIISYIHRIGRTGRAGRRGHAVTYFTESDLNFIRPIATVIKQAGFEVPEYTLKMRKPTKKEKKDLLKHAPKRKKIGPFKEAEKSGRRRNEFNLEETQTFGARFDITLINVEGCMQGYFSAGCGLKLFAFILLYVD